jgi:hypothetical protein
MRLALPWFSQTPPQCACIPAHFLDRRGRARRENGATSGAHSQLGGTGAPRRGAVPRDRIIITGTLPGACYAQGMTPFLSGGSFGSPTMRDVPDYYGIGC